MQLPGKALLHGTRNRGISLYQDCVELTRRCSAQVGVAMDHVPVDYLPEAFRSNYLAVLDYGRERRKLFCMKTLVFLQQAGYIRCRKEATPKGYLDQDYRSVPETGSLHETWYVMEDSVHNHLRIDGDRVLHRKGSTELLPVKTVVIPLSMSRGSLLVRSGDDEGLRQALYSCSHGAGRMRSRYDAMKYWRTVLKEKQRRWHRERFAELLGRNGEFPSGYIQEFDFAYKDSGDLLARQPYLKLVTQTRPVVTVKYTEI